MAVYVDERLLTLINNNFRKEQLEIRPSMLSLHFISHDMIKVIN